MHKTVWAELALDDGRAPVQFDASPWFKRAPDEHLIVLAQVGWKESHFADMVVEKLAYENTILASTLSYAEVNDIGYEVRIDPKDAVSWLEEHRPAVARKLPQSNRAA